MFTQFNAGIVWGPTDVVIDTSFDKEYCWTNIVVVVFPRYELVRGNQFAPSNCNRMQYLV